MDIVELLYSHENDKDTDAWMSCGKAADKIKSLREALNKVNAVLCVPAAEYVPAIGDAFVIIEAALKEGE